jgi:hypothetical protein
VLVGLDRIQHLRFAQLTAFGEAAGVQDQRLGIAVVFTQQHLQQRFGLAETALGEQRLGLLQWRGGGGAGICTWGSSIVRIADSGWAPAKPSTGWPSLNSTTVGRLRMPNWANLLLDVAVDLGQQQLALVALGDLRQQRHQRLARRAPLGPEVDQHTVCGRSSR